MKNALKQKILPFALLILMFVKPAHAAIDTNRAARLSVKSQKGAEYLTSLMEKAAAETATRRAALPQKLRAIIAPSVLEEERTLATKKALAPWLFVDGKPTEEGKVFLEGKAGFERAIKAANTTPKVDLGKSLRPRAKSSANTTLLRGGGASSSLSSSDARLKIIQWLYQPQFNRTIFELWLIDAPLNEWWDIFHAPTLSPTAWVISRIGPPDGVSGNIQQFFVAAPGQPQQTYFQIFLDQDVDFDGILDGFEAALFKTNPLDPDSNANGIADGDEDADGDGLSNIYELSLGTSPFIAQSSTDTDGDGLPNWMEQLITTYTGDASPSPQGDSDGDGVNNLTEFSLGTDPSYSYDAAFADFGGLPDEQQVILPQHFEFTTPAPSSPPGSITSDDEAYLHFTVSGFEGTTANFQVIKDMGANGQPSPGKDLIRWGIGFGQRVYATLPVLEPDNQDLGLLQNILITSTSTSADIWEKAKVSENLHQLTKNSLVYLQYRSMQRVVVQLRMLQIIQTQTPFPQGVLLRTRRALAVVHTEATVFRAATFELGQRFPLHDAFAKSGTRIAGIGRFAQCVSIYNNVLQTWPYLEQYLHDVLVECDSGASSDLLGYALAQLADDFKSGFVLFPFPYTFGAILCDVNPGCDATCN